MNNSRTNLILYPEDWEDYELLDFGDGKKLERLGKYIFIRPESQAFSPKELPLSKWEHVDGVFSSSKNDGDGKWSLSKKLPVSWTLKYDGLKIISMPTPFRHFGFFPEQSVHWQWCSKLIKKNLNQKKPKILNLFAYSGVASLHAARSGAEVTHVDASKKAINLAFKNRDNNRMENSSIRFITDDAIKFVQREIRRGVKYDGVVLDPPKYGRGPNGEKWNIETDLQNLLQLVEKLLSKDALFVVLTCYAIRSSHISLYNALSYALRNHKGELSSGELALKENGHSQRKLSCAIYARWERFI